MTIHIIHSWQNDGGQDEILKQLFLISKQNTKIMALIDDLKAQNTEFAIKIDALQVTVDAEQADIAALLAVNAQVVSDLNDQIAVLQDQIANGATPAQLQELIDANAAIIAKIDAASADVAGTV